MPDRPRLIIHIDLDAFFAAVEVLDNPDLAGQPVLIGGRKRGVVAAAAYPARAFGIRSAMPMFQALERCPDAIVLPARHDRYHEVSRRVMDLLHEVTPLVEPMSIDEAYLDLTDQIAKWEAGVLIARSLQRRVKEEIGLPASLGVATNKLVAKVASDHDKPEGLVVVRPGEEAAFLAPLSVRALWGVGPVTAEKLAQMGIVTVGELAQRSEGDLRARFGVHGAEMARQARGIDRRAVVTERERKSVSQERTFARDLRDGREMQRRLWQLSQGVARRLRGAEMVAATVSIKVRYADFTTLTRQMSLSVPTDDERMIYRAARVLLRRTWERGRPVRLLGVGGQNLSPATGQLLLL